MKIAAIGLALAMAGAAAPAAAQDRLAPPPGSQGAPRGAMPQRGVPPPAPQDEPMAELDERIAEIRDGLRLGPDQQRLWAPVEDGIRGVVRQREEVRRASRERAAAMREARSAGQRPPPRNVPEELRLRAEAAAGSAEALRRLAEAAAPLYDSLSDVQRRRFGLVIQALNPGRHPPRTGRNAPPRPRQGTQPPAPRTDPSEDGDPEHDDPEPEQRPR